MGTLGTVKLLDSAISRLSVTLVFFSQTLLFNHYIRSRDRSLIPNEEVLINLIILIKWLVITMALYKPYSLIETSNKKGIQTMITNDTYSIFPIIKLN